MDLKPLAFFFDADHESLGDLYGPPCTGALIQAALRLNPSPQTQLLRGDLLIHHVCYRLSVVGSDKNSERSRTISSQYSPDYDLLRVAVADFTSSLSDGFHTIDKVTFPRKIATGNTWTLILTHIRATDFASLNAALEQLPQYLGCAEVDYGNPLQLDAFGLLDGAYISEGLLHLRLDPEGDSEEGLASGYGYEEVPVFLTPEEFEQRKPGLLKPSISNRGTVSLQRVSRPMSHGERVGHEILRSMHKGDLSLSKPFEVPPKSSDQFRIDDRKLKDYLLNLNHVDGKGKAIFFRDVLAIGQGDWPYLKDQILHGMLKADLDRLESKQYGFSHGATIPVTGLNGRTVLLTTGWMFRDNIAHFVTAYPSDSAITTNLIANPSWIVSKALVGAEYWKELHRIADSAGIDAATKVVPVPMYLEGYAPVMEGKCGFAWVLIPDARTKFCRWLSRNGIGHRDYKSGWEVSADPSPQKPYFDYQSVEPKFAYAKAYADVLQRNGIDCQAEMRLD